MSDDHHGQRDKEEENEKNATSGGDPNNIRGDRPASRAQTTTPTTTSLLWPTPLTTPPVFTRFGTTTFRIDAVESFLIQEY